MPSSIPEVLPGVAESASRPGSLLVIGILNLLIGGVGIVWAGYSTATVVADRSLAGQMLTPAQQQDMARLDRAMSRKAPLLMPYQVVVYVLVPWFLVFCLLLSGVGLLVLRSWGRYLAILYAVVSMLHKLGMGAYTATYLLPFYRVPVATLANSSLDGAEVAVGTTFVIAVAMPLVLVLYPLMVLVIMCQSRVGAALRSKPAAGVRPAHLLVAASPHDQGVG